MSDLPQPKKVVYLFGAGATHAEIMGLYGRELTSEIMATNGLLISHVSNRVLAKARRNTDYTDDIGCTISERNANIEQLIGLLESNRVKNGSAKADLLRDLIKKDIQQHISVTPTSKRPTLYKGLIEFHKIEQIKRQELLTGLITMNYDNLLDEAYEELYEKSPNYYLNSNNSPDLPLLKLHGSFKWPKLKFGSNEIEVPIIPPGMRKNYLELPFTFIWGRAVELLAECDVLRIIGCSLDSTDWGLIELLYKAHFCAGKAFEIQIINFDDTGNHIRKNFGFFPRIIKAYEIDGGIIPGGINNPEENPLESPFIVWLSAKARRMLTVDEIAGTTYLKIVCGL